LQANDNHREVNDELTRQLEAKDFSLAFFIYRQAYALSDI